RGVGLWSRFSISEPLDDLALASFLVLAFRARGAQTRAWEWAVLAGLVVSSIGTIRSSVWLLLFLVAPAAQAARASKREWGYLAPLSCAAALATVAFAIGRGPV